MTNETEIIIENGEYQGTILTMRTRPGGFPYRMKIEPFDFKEHVKNTPPPPVSGYGPIYAWRDQRLICPSCERFLEN